MAVRIVADTFMKEIPANCLACRFCTKVYTLGTDYRACRIGSVGETSKRKIKNIYVRADWCPLREEDNEK